jgi:hypothetical protein
MIATRTSEEIRSRVSAVLRGGEDAQKYKDYYYGKESVCRADYVNRFNINTSYSTSSGQSGRGNINVIPVSGSSSSMSRAGPCFIGFK